MSQRDDSVYIKKDLSLLKRNYENGLLATEC